ncbi:MAG: hypothetical protein CL883_05345 [Dehalococcoidia bacterium]|nr:hypothetical protein [Dehalococcoidia bacterium]
MKRLIPLLTGFTFLVCLACVKDVDFDQIEDVVLTPVYEVDLIYSQFDTDDYIDNQLPPDTPIVVPPIQDTLNYDLTSTDFAIENLDRIELTFEFRNTIETSFEFTFQFLSSSNQPVGISRTIFITPGEGENTQPVISYSDPNPIVIDDQELGQLSTARRLATELRVNNANSNLRGRLELRSKAAYYINYDL